MPTFNAINLKLNKSERVDFEIGRLEDYGEDGITQTGKSHFQQAFKIMWLQESPGNKLENDFNHNDLPDTVLFLTPGMSDQFRVIAGARGYVISFSASFLCNVDISGEFEKNMRVFKYLSQEPGIPILAVKNVLNNLLGVLLNEFENKQPFRSELMRYYLRIFLVLIIREAENVIPGMQSNTGNWLFNRFIDLLEQNFKEQKTVAYYAAELCISPNYLNQLIKKNEGCCAGQMIRNRIIKEAKRKASISNYSMKETAYHLGFEDVYHFSKFFKNESGVNYSQFRKINPTHLQSRQWFAS